MGNKITTVDNNAVFPWEKLPSDIALQILKYLDCATLVSLASTNKKWNNIASSNQIWEHIYIQEFGPIDMEYFRLKGKTFKTLYPELKDHDLNADCIGDCIEELNLQYNLQCTPEWHSKRFKCQTFWCGKRYGTCVIQLRTVQRTTKGRSISNTICRTQRECSGLNYVVVSSVIVMKLPRDCGDLTVACASLTLCYLIEINTIIADTDIYLHKCKQRAYLQRRKSAKDNNLLGRVASLIYKNQILRILMLGFDGAGKTTILYKLKLGESVANIPTIGFQVETVEYRNLNFTVWDIPLDGESKLRPLWKHYFANTTGIIWVVDATDRDHIHDNGVQLARILQEPDLANCIVLIFANKFDLPSHMSCEEIHQRMNLDELVVPFYLQACTATIGDGLYEDPTPTKRTPLDPRLTTPTYGRPEGFMYHPMFTAAKFKKAVLYGVVVTGITWFSLKMTSYKRDSTKVDLEKNAKERGPWSEAYNRNKEFSERIGKAIKSGSDSNKP